MDTTLLIVLLGIALLAIVALPSLLRKKGDASSLPPLESVHANAPALRPAKMATLEELQSQWFVRWLCEQGSAQTGIDLTRDPMALTRITEAASKAQAEIEADGHAEIVLPYIAANASGPKHFNLKVTREQLASARQSVGILT